MADELKKKPDVILSNGKEIFLDLHKVTRNEWRGIWSVAEAEDKSDESISKISGIPTEDLGNLPLDDWRMLTQALVKKFKEPINPT